MDQVFTKEDREILDQLRNGIRQDDGFLIEPIVEEAIEDIAA
ncbi:MAG: hypothetical protein QXR48_04215 [Candidatus Woesearchaeota archaeon]